MASHVGISAAGNAARRAMRPGIQGVDVDAKGEKGPEQRRQEAVQRKERVSGAPAEQHCAFLGGEQATQGRGWRKSRWSEAGQGERVARHREDRSEEVGQQPIPSTNERLEQATPRPAVFAKRAQRVVDRAIDGVDAVMHITVRAPFESPLRSEPTIVAGTRDLASAALDAGVATHSAASRDATRWLTPRGRFRSRSSARSTVGR